jgi:flagellar motor switch/type III secretory pathway protein FliN
MTIAEQLARLDDVPVYVDVSLAVAPMSIREILSLRPGGVIVTPLRAGANVDFVSGGARIGEGELSHDAGRPVLRLVRTGSKR